MKIPVVLLCVLCSKQVSPFSLNGGRAKTHEITSLGYKDEAAGEGRVVVTLDSSDQLLLGGGTEEGGGLRMSSDYNDNSASQSLGASRLTPFLQRAAAEVSQNLLSSGDDAEQPFRVCEYGCATGGSSIAPIGTIRDAIGHHRHLSVTMVDLPGNDWDVLAKTVEPEFPSVDFAYEPTSMYLPISDEGSVHLAYSCYAQQWLSEGAPTGLSNGELWANQASPESKERKAWAEASKRDLEKMLSIRAREMAPGGMLVFHIQSSMSCGGLFDKYAATMQQAKKDMISDGELSKKEARAMVIPEYMKSPTEILAPLTSGPNKRLWSVEEMQYTVLPCPFLDEMDKCGFDADEGIENQLLIARSCFDSTLAPVLGGKKLELFWNRVRDLASDDLEAISTKIMATFIVLKRSHAKTLP